MGHVEEELASYQASFRNTDLFPFRGFMHRPDQILNVQHDHQSDKNDQHQDNTAEEQGVVHLLGSVFLHEQFPQPHQCGIDQQGEQHDPGSGDPFVFRQAAALDGVPVKHETEQAPQGQKQKSLAAHGVQSHQVRDDLDDSEYHRNDRAENTGGHDPVVGFGFCSLIRRGAGIAVGDDSAEGRQVHKPVEGIPAQQ